MKYNIYNDAIRQWAIRAIKEAPVGSEVRIRTPDKRSLEQNNLMWALLNDLSNQTDWHGRRLNAHQWKILLSAALTKADSVPSLDGEAFVALGLNTSDFGKATMADMIELIYSFGAERGVQFKEDSNEK